MKVLTKIVGKTKIDRKRSQQILRYPPYQLVGGKRRRGEWDQQVTRMDADR